MGTKQEICQMARAFPAGHISPFAFVRPTAHATSYSRAEEFVSPTRQFSGLQSRQSTHTRVLTQKTRSGASRRQQQRGRICQAVVLCEIIESVMQGRESNSTVLGRSAVKTVANQYVGRSARTLFIYFKLS